MSDPKTYSWYRPYQRAILEKDFSLLADRIDDALTAIEHRLGQGHLDDTEFAELQVALKELVLLPY